MKALRVICVVLCAVMLISTFAGCAGNNEYQQEEAALVYEGDKILSDSTSAAIELSALNAEFSDDISTEDILVGDAFADMSVDGVTKTAADRITVTLSGKIADEGIHGDVAIAEKGFKNGAYVASAEIGITNGELFTDAKNITFADGKLSIPIVADGYKFASDIKKEDISYSGGSNGVTLDDVKQNGDDCVVAVMATNAKDIDSAAELLDGEFVVSAKAFGGKDDAELSALLPFAGITGVLSFDENEDNGTNAVITLFVNNGSIGDVTVDDIKLGGDIAAAKIASAEKKEDGNIEITLKNVPKENAGGTVEIVGADYNNLWGSAAKNNIAAVSYLNYAAQDRSFDSIAEWVKEHAGTFDTVKTICSTGNTAVSAAQALSELFGLSESDGAKAAGMFSELSSKIDSVQTSINALMAGQAEIKAQTQLTNFDNYALNLTNTCDEFYRDFFDALSADLVAEYADTDALWNAIGEKYMEVNNARLVEEAKDREKWMSVYYTVTDEMLRDWLGLDDDTYLDDEYKDVDDEAAKGKEDSPKDGEDEQTDEPETDGGKTGDDKTGDDKTSDDPKDGDAAGDDENPGGGNNDGSNDGDQPADGEDGEDELTDELVTDDEPKDDAQWSEETGDWVDNGETEAAGTDIDTGRSFDGAEGADPESIYRAGLARNYYEGMPLTAEDIAKAEVAQLYEKAKLDRSVLDQYTETDSNGRMAAVLMSVAAQYKDKTVYGNAITVSYKTMCDFIAGTRNGKTSSAAGIANSYDQLVNSSYNWETDAYAARSEYRAYLKTLLVYAYPVALSCDLARNSSSKPDEAMNKFTAAYNGVENNPTAKITKEGKEDYIYCHTTNKYYYKYPLAYRPANLFNHLSAWDGPMGDTGKWASSDAYKIKNNPSADELNLIIARAYGMGRTMREDLLAGGFTGPALTTNTDIKYLITKFSARHNRHVFKADEMGVKVNALDITQTSSTGNAPEIQNDIEVLNGKIARKSKNSWLSPNTVVVALSTDKDGAFYNEKNGSTVLGPKSGVDETKYENSLLGK